MDFVAATSVSEAAHAKAEHPDAEFLAGGTDLMVEVNLSHHRPESVIGLRKIEELTAMDGHRIGAGVTWARLEQSSHTALAQAARTVGSPQIRAAGTIGGNIGTASPAGDGLPWIAALDGAIEVASTSGTRTIPWDEFFTGVKQTSLGPDELVTSVVLDQPAPRAQQFAKVGVRNAMVISTVSCVVALTESGTRVALGSVAPTPIRASQAEAMINAEAGHPSPSAIEEFGRLVSDEVRPITDHRSTEAYRRHAAGVLASRLLERCLQR